MHDRVPCILRRSGTALVLASIVLSGCAPEPHRVAAGAGPELRWYRALAIDAAGGDVPAMLGDPGGGLWAAVPGLPDPKGRSRLFYRPPGGTFRTLYEGPFATELSLSSLHAGEVYFGHNRPLDAFRPTWLRVSETGVTPLPAPAERLDELELLQMGGYVVRAPDDGFACGQHGRVFHFDGAQWTPVAGGLPWAPGDPAGVSFCAGIHFAARDGLIVDTRGRAASWDGTSFRPIPDAQGFSFLASANGLARSGATLARFEGGAFVRLEGAIPESAPLIGDADGKWVAFPGGVVEIGPRTARLVPSALPFSPRAIAEADGALWALGADGIYRATRRDVPTFVPAGPEAPAPGLLYAIAVDIDQDGDEDLLGLRAPAGESEGARASMFVAVNDGAGRFTEASLGLPDDVAVWRDRFDAGDVDGDGDVDVVTVSSSGRVELWLQEGGRFVRVMSREAHGATVGFADVDGDGDLDLSLLPASPALLLNDGAGHFREGPALPLPASRVERALWADVDGDGRVDAILQHWRDPAHLLHNTGHGFELVSLPVVAEGALVADLEREGRPTILAQKIHVRGVALPFARCRCTESGCALVEDAPIPAGVIADLNLDGRPDIIGTDLRGDEAIAGDGEVHLAGPEGFERVTDVAGALPRPTPIDADGDGDGDVYTPALGLRVNTGAAPRFLRVRPRASRSDRLSRGAVVVARRAGDATIVATGRADHGVLTLGLPDATARYDVEVRFPAGERRIVTGLAAGTELTVRDCDTPLFSAHLAALWLQGTWQRASLVRDLLLPALAAALATVAFPRRARAALLVFAAAWLGLAGVFVRARGAVPWLLAPTAFAVTATAHGLDVVRIRRRAGRVAGPYLLEERLGAGAAATVWRARAGRQVVALKLFAAEAMGSPEARERFFREARVGSEIRHPNVVRIREAGTLEDGRCFLAMDLVEGRPLSEILRVEGRLAPATVTAIGADVARALAVLHEAGIVHRDVKPENILVRPDGAAVLTDLGLARSTLFRTLTRHDVAVGTLAYMSPEQCVGRPLDGRSDIWSLGVTLYEALTGARAFDGKHELELVYLIHNVDPKRPSQLVPDLPEALEAAVLRCLSRDPEARFAGAADLLAALGVPREARAA
ncbi:serine/threonine protein kinase [Minicystis rosea]|nr:serine/threonine protein kinase [Minicystis rosea]